MHAPKNEIHTESLRIELNEKWKSIYFDFFNNTKNIIKALNKTNNFQIEYSFPTLPTNVFSTNYKKYQAKINFKNNIQWLISLIPRKNSGDNFFPAINIEVLIDNRKQDEITIILYPEENRFVQHILYSPYLNLPLESKERTISNLIENIKEMVELQLIKINSSK